MGRKENYTHVLHKPEMARMRALSKAIGYDDDDIHRFRIGIQNTWSETAAGHVHLRQLTEAVRAGILQAGGVPIEFGGYGGCPIDLGENGHRYDTPSRDIMAMDLETCAQLHSFDGLVLLSSCDKNVPAHLLGAARLNLPTIIVVGGPMQSGRFKCHHVDMSDLDPFSWRCETNPDDVDYSDVQEMTECLCPGPGSCALLGTANTMQCVTEALGMTLPGNSTTCAGTSQLLRLSKRAGRRIVDLVDQNVKARDVMTPEAMENAIHVLHAIGGGTNAIVHILALAKEMDMLDRINLPLIEQLGRSTPCITPVKPSGPWHLEDLGEAGGIQAVMQRLGDRIHRDCVTVNGKTVGENVDEARIVLPEIIRPLDRPVFSEGLYVMHGNLADSAIARPTVISRSMFDITGPARVFDSMESCLEALRRHQINPGDMIVLRYEGPRGGPGLTDVFKVLGYLVALNLHEKCAVITDGKISGFAKGPFVCQVTPEAAVGGTIALVEEGDPIHMDLNARRIDLLVDEDVLAARRKAWKPKPCRAKTGLLTLYAKLALPATEGAGIPLRIDE